MNWNRTDLESIFFFPDDEEDSKPAAREIAEVRGFGKAQRRVLGLRSEEVISFLSSEIKKGEFKAGRVLADIVLAIYNFTTCTL